MPRGGARKGAGRKTSPYSEKTLLRCRPEDLQWLRNQPGTIAEIIAKLIEAERKRQGEDE